MASKPLKPQALRGVLVIILIAVMAFGAGLFYLGIEEVRRYAIEVNHSVIDAEASASQVDKLQKLKTQLVESEVSIAKADTMFATPANFKNQAITDVRSYANASGLTVTKASFDDKTAEGIEALTVNLQSPVSYAKLVQFLDAIEGNIPKMKVSSIMLDTLGGGADTVKLDYIKITVATR